LKRKTLILGILITALFFLAAPHARTETEPGQPRHLIWEVTSKESRAYLVGSIHLGKKKMYPMAPAVEKAFAESDVLVVEVDLNAIPPMQARAIMMKKGMYLNGDRLVDHLSADLRHRLRKKLNQFRIGLLDVAYFKPWFASLVLLQAQVKALGYDPDLGVDQHFLDRAYERKMQVDQFETMEEQASFLDAIEDQDLFLEYTLDSLDDTEQELEKLITSWRQGDHETLKRFLIDDLLEENPGLQSMIDLILYKRNENMSRKIVELLKTDQVYFIVVGSAHYFGEQGIVEILKRTGYQIRQL